MLTSTRRGIDYPNPDRSDTADVPRDIGSLLDAVEVDVYFGQGVIADRPVSSGASPGIAGRFWYATDDLTLTYDYGTGWTDDLISVFALADGSVTTAKLADLAVTTAKLAAASVTAAKIADNVITAAKLVDALVPTRGAGSGTEALRALGTAAGLAAAGSHHAQHEPSGADPMTVDAVAATGSLRTLGTGAQQAMPGNDSRINSVVVATTVAGLGTATDGKIGRIRAGSSPYAWKTVIYDATYGKWVGEEVFHRAGGQTGTNIAYTDSGGNTTGAEGMEIWRIFDTAGLKPEFKVGGYFSAASASFAASFAAGYRAMDDGATRVASVVVTASELTTTDINGTHWRYGPWAVIGGGYTVKDYFSPTWQGKVTNSAHEWLANTNDGLAATVSVRWVG